MSGNYSNTINAPDESTKLIETQILVDTDGETVVIATDLAGNTTTKMHNIKFLYTLENERTENSGGWSTNYYYDMYGNIANISYNTDLGLSITANPTTVQQGRLGTWYTNNLINLSEYDKLRTVGWIDESSTGDIELRLDGELKHVLNVNTVTEKAENGYWARLNCDISELDENRHIVIGTNGELTDFIRVHYYNVYMFSFK